MNLFIMGHCKYSSTWSHRCHIMGQNSSYMISELNRHARLFFDTFTHKAVGGSENLYSLTLCEIITLFIHLCTCVVTLTCFPKGHFKCFLAGQKYPVTNINSSAWCGCNFILSISSVSDWHRENRLPKAHQMYCVFFCVSVECRPASCICCTAQLKYASWLFMNYTVTLD